MNKMIKRKYAIVSPGRNEAKFMRNTLDSVVTQTIQPALWVIVNDGSTDETADILQEYAKKYSFIQVVNRENRGHRSVGPGVIDAFYEGYNTLNIDDFDFICKLDLDLILPEKYFEILMQRMEANPRLGNCSGKPYYRDKVTGELVSEFCGDENAIGASKFYRSSCFKQIGGFVRQVMWDGIDGHRCRMLGWIACSWDDEEIRFIHLRPMGSSHKGIITGRKRHGFGQYFMGTGVVYMAATSVYRMIRRPFVVGGAAMMWGYIHSWMTRKSQLDDPDLVAFIRKYQWACLLQGKKKATAELNARQETVWSPDTTL